MAFSRKSTLAAVAGSLSLAMLTGCPGPTAPVATPTPTAPVGTASPTESPAPGATATPAAGESPAAVPSKSPLEVTTLKGKVYDEDGAVVDGATVAIKSLNASNPFETTVNVVGGAYVANEVPSGVQVEVTASKDGWTKRTRIETLLPLSQVREGNIVDFGSAQYAEATQRTSGSPYFISENPEIAMVEPAIDATNVAADKVNVVLTFSEALDETNQRRVTDAIRLAAVTDLAKEETRASAYAVAYDETRRTVFEGAQFLDSDNLATVTWNAEGTVATLAFGAPLLQDDGDSLQYQIGLLADANIVDKDNNQLGSRNAAGVVTEAFKAKSLSVSSANAWNDTHINASTFKVAEDDDAPTVTGISVSGGNRISITFSEPMVAYGGDSAATAVNLTTMETRTNYEFKIAESTGDLDGETWETGSADVHNGTWGSLGGETTGDAFFFGATNATFEVLDSDPKTVRISANSGDKFNVDAKAIKVKVVGIADPATNNVKTAGDANYKTGSI